MKNSVSQTNPEILLFLVLVRVMSLPSPNWDPRLIYQSPLNHSGSSLYTKNETSVHIL